MAISRRRFMLGAAGAAAGLILPGYYRRALEFIDRTGQPLLEPAARPVAELTVYQGDWTDLKYGLAIGDPRAGPPPMTLREFFERYDIDPYEDGFVDEEEEPDWDRQLNLSDDFYHDTWMYREAPQKLAYELLHGLDLGPKIRGPDAVGELKLEAGSSMVSSYWNVEAADEITLSLLQERLNALGTGVRIVIALVAVSLGTVTATVCRVSVAVPKFV